MSIATIPIRLTWTGATGSPGANVWHSRVGGDLGGNQQDTIATSWLQDFYTSIRGIFPNSLTVSFDGQITGLGVDLGDTADFDSWSVQGNGGDGFLPPATAVLVSWRTNSGGRRGRGRNFFGPCANGIFNGSGEFASATRSVMQDAVDTLVGNGASGLNGALGVYSRSDGVVRDFVGGDVRAPFAVLRSRRD